MATFSRFGTLTADEVEEVQLPVMKRTPPVEVLNFDDEASIFVVIVPDAESDVQPVIDGDNVDVVPPGSSLEVRGRSGGVVRLLSSGTPKYSVKIE